VVLKESHPSRIVDAQVDTDVEVLQTPPAAEQSRMFERMGAAKLLVDRAAAAEPLSEPEFARWARDQRVFVSSVMDELAEERRILADRIQGLGSEPVLFERFGGRDDDAEAAYVHEVGSSSVYVGILGRRYGRQLPSRYSATHAEYLAAEQQGLKVTVWAKDVEDREGHQESFLQEVQIFHTTGRFSTPQDLAEGVDERLRKIAAQDVAPWAKLGDVVFRARTITETAAHVEVSARVRDPDIVARLETMRPDRWGRGFQGTLTYSGRVRRSTVEDIQLTTTASTGAEARLSLETGELDRDSVFQISMSSGGRTYSAQDLTEIGLRRVLLGEVGPLDQFTEGMSVVPDPFAQFGRLALSEEIVNPIAHLMLTETLVGEGRASRITRFRLGPPVSGRRRLELEWEGPGPFDGVDAERRRIEGVLILEK
jgi:Domain of unknown function (DUF4062)